MITRPFIEIIAVSPSECYAIQHSGADRIYLVSALEVGGLTPSHTVIRKCLEAVDIPVFVMARHHNIGFVYSPYDVQLLKDEVVSLKYLKVPGIVIGGITKEGEIDSELMSFVHKYLTGTNIHLTFHKAIDQTHDIIKSATELEQYGVNTILTQGGRGKILENSAILYKLINRQLPVNILVGGSVNQNNISDIIKTVQPKQVHVGTAVRKDKYGPIDLQLLTEFIRIASL